MKDIINSKSIRFLLLFLFVPLWLSAQNITVKGTVNDKNGEALIGAGISVKGTSTGTVADLDGNYTLSVPDEKATLVFSYLGYLTQEIAVGNRRIIDVTLVEDSKTLDEIVVIGYGTMKKSDLTGAITSVKADAISKSVPTSLEQVLQGRAAGVQVQQNSGMPGSSASIRIRGVNSLNAATEPIYVVDGVVIDGQTNSSTTGALSTINPQDIVSMDILKDASATAIYGSRASNGVIMITTKRGNSGEARINYNGYAGWQEIPKLLDVLNLRDYAAHRNVLAENGLINRNNNYVRPDLLGEGTNWQKELFSLAFMQSHNLSLSGGTEKQTYSLSAGYLDQDGIAAGSAFKRINVSGTFDSKIKPWAKTGVNFAFAQTNQKLTVSDQGLVNVALRTPPDVPVQNIDGSFSAPDEQFMPTNPMAMVALIDNRREVAEIRATPYLELAPEFLKGLTYKSELSLSYSFISGDRFSPTYKLSETQFSIVNQRDANRQYNKYYRWSNTLTYNKTFDIHAINAMLGQEMSKSMWDYLSGMRNGFIVNSGMPAINLGDITTASNGAYAGANALMSYFGRLFYSLKEKYLLTATIRRDGSSKFAPEHRWGWFPSAAFAWRASEEDFIKNMDAINNLKLRLGWGLVGNQNVGTNYGWLTTYGISPTSWGISGLLADNTPNPQLQWESTTSTNVGIDLGLFKQRLELTIDLYYKKTDNLIFKTQLPAYVGTTGQGASDNPWVNLGALENKGFEVSVNTVNFQKRDFQWTTNAVFSLNRNKMLKFNTENAEVTSSVADYLYWGGTGSTVINRTIINRPIGQFYGYQVIGRFENATDFYYKNDKGEIVRTPVMSNLPIDEASGVWIGDYIYRDQNEDGMIDEKDRTFIGNPEPKFTYGLGNSFTYKNWDLTVFFTGSYGNDVVNYARRYMENPRRNISNLFSSALDYAKLELINPDGPNDYRNVQIVGGGPYSSRLALSTATSDYNFAFSDRFIEDGSYIRLQNISVGYTLPEKWIKSTGIDQLKLYANIQNVYTWTKYRGYDPEIGLTYGNSTINGLDNGRYPSPRIYTVGLNLTF
ncbi:MAG: TonB-dependent receptor [Dysgonamonadaceae bacterium]|nr:TonB-dependent receptor [Dysgonamonadaceae bacterium]